MRTAPAVLLLALAGLPLAAQTIQPDTEFQVKLTSPLSTETAKKGDKISALVVTPQEFAGSVMEGEVKESKNGNKIHGKSVLNFGFSILNHNDKQIPVEASIKSFTNSKGQENVDEEGRVISKKSNVGKAAVGTGIGALIGGIAGGAKGAAIGAGVGAAASLVLIQVAATGPSIKFDSGSVITLSVKEGRKSGS